MTQAMTTTAGEAVGPINSIVRSITPMPTAGKTVAAMFQAGPHVTDPIPSGPLKGCSLSLVKVLTDTVAKGASHEQLYMFINQAMTYNLDPLRKEIWCIDMGGQWMIAPSRDGFLRMAQRHPNFDQITSGVVREGDDYKIDTVNGSVVHLVQGMGNQNRPILGAWCIVATKDRKRFAHQVLFSEVVRPTPVWKANPAQMTEKSAVSQALRKSGLFSDLYVSDRVWEAMETHTDALLVYPTAAEYVDGFAVDTGTPAPQIAAAAEPAATPLSKAKAAWLDRVTLIAKSRGHNVETLKRAKANFTFHVIGKANLKDVTAANGGVDEMAKLDQALDAPPMAFTEWLTKAAEAIAAEAAAKEAEKAAAVAVTDDVETDEAKEARWQAEAIAKEKAEADAERGAA